jgi:predicted methyltransferase
MMDRKRVACAAILVIAILVGIAAALRPAFAQVPPVAPGVTEQPAIPDSQIPNYIKQAVNSPERPAADKAIDAGRKPEQMLAFFGIKPGMKVADLSAASGWMTELLARTVGPTGTVYSQNRQFPPKFKKVEDLWHKRLQEPGLKNVVAVVQSFDSDQLLPVAPGTLDAVIINLNYHDLINAKVNMDKMNATVFKALKPGGVYGIVDHIAKAGTGIQDTSTLHRIDPQFVITQVEKAGFKLDAASSALRNPADPHTVKSFLDRGHTDRFMFKFVKP